MNLNIRTPCNDCPFRRDTGTPVRLMRGRIEEIVSMIAPPPCAPGGTFACHKTTGVAGSNKPREESHCAGAILFASKQNTSTNYVRIVARMERLTEDDFHGAELVFDDLEEMLASAIDAKPKRKRRRKDA